MRALKPIVICLPADAMAAASASEAALFAVAETLISPSNLRYSRLRGCVLLLDIELTSSLRAAIRVASAGDISPFPDLTRTPNSVAFTTSISLVTAAYFSRLVFTC